MTKYSALIVDDELLARKRISDLLASDTTVDITGECKNGYEAVKTLQKEKCDLLFLDIQMPDIDGFGVIETIKRRDMPSIVFVTAYDHYALKAFSVNAIDYLLKPFDDEQFYNALAKAKMNILNRTLYEINLQINSLKQYLYNNDFLYGGHLKETENSSRQFQEQFAVKNNGKIYFIKATDIQWVEATGNYVCFHTLKGRHLIRSTINSIAVKLNPLKFVRIHRSFIINIDYISHIETVSHGNYVFKMSKGDKITASRTYNSEVKKFLKRIS